MIDIKNSEGYDDPTTYKAIRNLDREYRHFRRLLFAIFDLCELYGFRLEGRITLVDKRSGRVWR